MVLIAAAAAVYGFTKLGDPPVKDAGSTPGYVAGSSSARVPTLSLAGVGDSVTYNSNSWYRQVVEGRVPGMTSVGDFGIPTATTARVLAESLPKALAAKPDVVTIEAGTNDLLGAIPPAEAMKNIDKMIAKAQAAGVKVILVAVPPNDQHPDLVGPMNAAIAAEAKKRDIRFLDMDAPIITSAGAYASGDSDDGRHPNDAGAGKMTAVAAKFFTTYLASS